MAEALGVERRVLLLARERGWPGARALAWRREARQAAQLVWVRQVSVDLGVVAVEQALRAWPAGRPQAPRDSRVSLREARAWRPEAEPLQHDRAKSSRPAELL